MKPLLYTLLLFFVCILADAQQSRQNMESEKLARLFEEYFETQLKLDPIFATSIGDNRFNDQFPNSIGPEHRLKAAAIERDFAKRIRTIDPTKLEGQDLLSYEIFKRARDLDIEAEKYPEHLLPVDQFGSAPTFFVQLGSGDGLHPFKTVKDYDDFLGRMDGVIVWMNQSVTNMKEGIKKGIVQPAVLMEKTLPQLSAQISEKAEQSQFWSPIQNMPKNFNQEDRRRLTEAYRDAIENKLIPAYRMLHDYIKNDYLKHARKTVGMNALPGGDAWYAYRVKRSTTTDLQPEAIHQIGLREVARIHDEMRKVMKDVDFKGDLKEFFAFTSSDPQFFYKTPEELVKGYEQLKDRINPLTHKLFDVVPKADYEVRAVEKFREKSASGGSYQAATPDGSRPGIFYVNTYDLTARPKWAMESLSLHEAAPGHHFQISIQRELETLPRFRRFGSYTAYVEGWGLYAESLGKELGVYSDPYQYFGALTAELWRAIRLVVDTGLHNKGWTREQVLDYMYSNSPVKEARAVSEAERYIALPAQALAYKIGEMKIRELRTRAEKGLGEKFDIKEFHNRILLDGALPLDVLEAKIDRWIESR